MLNLFRKSFDALPFFDSIHDSFNITGPEYIIFPDLGKLFGCVNNQNIIIAPSLFQYHDNRRNSCSKEDVGGKTDNCVNFIFFDQILADFPFFAATEQNPVRKNDCHNSFFPDVIEVVQKKRIIRFPFRRDAISGVTGVILFILWIPCLRVRRIGDNGIHIKRFVCFWMTFFKIWPVFFQCIAVASLNVIRKDSTHDQIHSGKIVGVFFQFLRVIFDTVVIAHMPSRTFSNINKKRA
ncbi:hypothetical protein SDC9_69971 [bioreactor metagenome]|uniref:Uncharacterized protein n=1 Tax=bioreactor metagenome TaxID=1076179 RepID=A0A644Y5N2_9ZZZZ